jgi:hypothetical protein
MGCSGVVSFPIAEEVFGFAASSCLLESFSFSGSEVTPGVLAVFEDPKEAKAPEPSPKALEAPLEEGVVNPAVGVVKALYGFDLPCDDSPPPKRFALDKLREDSVLEESLEESLLEF